MKFQIPYSKNFQYFNKDDTEIFINYKPEIKKLDTFITQYSDYRIVIAFGQKEMDKGGLILKDLEIIQALAEKHPNIVLRVPQYYKAIERDLNKYNIPHYYQYIVNNWEDFLGFLSLNVTDIRIGGNLCFCLTNARNFAKEKGIKLRCYCNYCEKNWDVIPAIKNFFIRPEDISLYANYIDVFEFYRENRTISMNTYYKIYAINQSWFGSLKEIIFNYDSDEDNRTILPEFALYRKNCKRKCLEGGTCFICDRICELSYILDEKNFIIKYSNP